MICAVLGLKTVVRCDQKVVGSTPTRGCCVLTPTQRAIPTGSVNEGYVVKAIVRLIGAVVCLPCCVSRCMYH